MLGRTLLPLFGGTACVWTVCLVAYQVLLLGGSLYADALSRRRTGVQAKVHLALLALSALWLAAFAFLRPRLGGLVPDAGSSAGLCGAALLCVFLSVGVPYVILGAGSSLLQKWALDALGGGRETYRLYVVSNIGSFAGLLLYPLAIEPFVPQSAQWAGYAAAFALYLALCAYARRGAANADGPAAETRDAPGGDGGGSVRAALPWLLLPGLSTYLLDAVTTHLSTDVSPFPMMWVVLLGAFLLSYSVGFSRIGEKLMPLWAAAALASLCYAVHVLRGGRGDNIVFYANFTAGISLIFLGGCFLHSWLCRLRPEGGRLTRYYLCIAVGGAAGGLLAGVVPPLVFDRVAEYPAALLALAAALLSAPLLAWPETSMRVVREFSKGAGKGAVAGGLGVAFCVFAVAVGAHDTPPFPVVHERGRNFYGAWMVARDVLTVDADVPAGFEKPHYNVTVLQNGNTTHGLEPEDEAQRTSATAYYGPLGGGLAFTLHPKYAAANGKVNAGIVGMGAGTQAWYGRPGDTMTFYEIDPAVVDAATNHFTFLGRCKADVRIEVADARKALERELPERTAGRGAFDILVVDAYSGDSVPFHLVTRQAFELYAGSLAKGGILALHISNWHLDLLPVCKAAMAHLGMNGLATVSRGGLFTWDSSWVFLSKSPLGKPDDVTAIDWGDVRDVPLPDDGRGSLVPYIRFKR